MDRVCLYLLVFYLSGTADTMALTVAVVCSSNQNRSMESHHLLRFVKQSLKLKIVGFGWARAF